MGIGHFNETYIRGNLVAAFQNDDWTHYNLSFDQIFLNGNAGFELAFDHQEYSREVFVPFQGYTGVFVDLMPYYYGEENPNFGRPFVANRTSKRELSDERDSFRATAYYKLDPEAIFPESKIASWLGKHTFTGLFNSYEQEERNDRMFQYYDADELDQTWNTSDAIASGRRKYNYFVYLGDSVVGLDSPEDVRLTGLGSQKLWDPGQTLSYRALNADNGELETRSVTASVYTDRINTGMMDVDSTALIWNGSFLNNHLIGLYGWRQDDAVSINREALIDDELVAIPESLNDPDSIIQELDKSIQTRTWSVVAHVPERFLPKGTGLTFYYGESENFSLEATPTDFYGNQLPNPSGDTKEYGFTLKLFEDKLVARVNWFESVIRNDTADSVYEKFINQGILKPYGYFLEAEFNGFEPETTDPDTGDVDPGTPNFDLAVQTLNELKEVIPQALLERANLLSVDANGIVNRNDISGIGDTQDVKATGTEFELVYNPVRNWRISLNVAKQEAIVTNFSPRMAELIDLVDGILLAGSDAGDLRYFNDAGREPPQFPSDPAPEPGSSTATIASWNEENVLSEYRLLKSQEGRASPEQRKWRVNFVTNYNFRDGFLDGWSIGSAVRWQEGAIIGYPTTIENGLKISDVANPHVSPSETTVDAWIRYRRKLFNRKVDWTIELRVFNLNTNADELIPVRSTTSEEYEVAVWRVGQPRYFRLTNTFKF